MRQTRLEIVLAGLMFTAAFLASICPARAVGFQYLSVPDGPAPSIDIGIWYPSEDAVVATTLGLLPQTVAVDGAVNGHGLPLVVISHGSGGWFGDYPDSAAALAEAGFVVVAPTHRGDNFKDNGRNGLAVMIDRPRQIRRVLDYMTQVWAGHERINPQKIGFFGFSAGGTTGLILLGATPDWSLFAPHCAAEPDEPVCHEGVATALSRPKAASLPQETWQRDVRIKAAVLASPGFSFAFGPQSLGRIEAPLQLWGAAGDRVVPFASNVAYLQRYLPPTVNVHDVADAGHYAFLPPCSDDQRAKHPDICTDSAAFDRQAFRKSFNQALVAFFHVHLQAE